MYIYIQVASIYVYFIVALVAASIAAITTVNCARTFLMRYIIIIITTIIIQTRSPPFAHTRTHTYIYVIYELTRKI